MIESKIYKKPPVLAGKEFCGLALEKSLLNCIRLSIPVKCDLRCIYCYSNAGKKKGTLKFKQILKVIKEAKGLGTKTVMIVGRGEPLHYKKFFELLEFINTNKMVPLIFTNGTLITEDIAKKLFDCNASIVTKLNSFDKETQNLLCNFDCYDKLVTGLNNLIKAGFNRENPSRLGIDSIVCKQNIKEIPALFRFCRESNIVPIFESVTIKGRAKEHNLKPDKEEFKKLVYNLLEIDRKEYGFSWNPGAAHLTTAQTSFSKTCFIDEDGFVYPSTASDKSAGSFLDKPLKEIIQTPLFEEIKSTDKHFVEEL